MWTNENRGRYDRKGLRYPGDLRDEEWRSISPLIPPAKRGGNKRTVVMREVVHGLMYIPGDRLPVPAGRAFAECSKGGGAAKGFTTTQHGERLFLPLEP